MPEVFVYALIYALKRIRRRLRMENDLSSGGLAIWAKYADRRLINDTQQCHTSRSKEDILQSNISRGHKASSKYDCQRNYALQVRFDSFPTLVEASELGLRYATRSFPSTSSFKLPSLDITCLPANTTVLAAKPCEGSSGAFHIDSRRITSMRVGYMPCAQTGA